MRMKLIIGSMLMVFLLASSGFAQSKVTGGAKGGLNIADISYDPEQSNCCDMKAGGVVGGFVNIGLNDVASIQPEVLFSMKGAKYTSGSFTGKINFNVVEIPILVRANLTKGQARPFIVIGPGVSFRTTAKLEIEDQEEDIKDDTESTDVGVIFGGGVAVGRATVEARYDLGLRDLNKGDSLKAKTRTFSVLVGIGIG